MNSHHDYLRFCDEAIVVADHIFLSTDQTAGTRLFPIVNESQDDPTLPLVLINRHGDLLSDKDLIERIADNRSLILKAHYMMV